jgi:hypothetical protein
MESSYSIDRGANLVWLKVWGVLTADALIDLLNRAGADPLYRAGMNAIADYREARGNWDYSEIQRFRDYVMTVPVRGEVRWAAIVRSSDLAAIGHMLIIISEAVGSDIKLRLFEDQATALRWVRRELDEPQQFCLSDLMGQASQVGGAG